MPLLEWVKEHLPLDLGQGARRATTKGKQVALDLVPPGAGRRALDVGCREGNQSRWLERRGYVVTSIDVERLYDKCQVVDANKALPFADGSFDLIWCSEVLEHLVDPVFAARELRRVLRPGGELILTTPNSYCLLFRFIALFGLTPRRIQRRDHLHFFDVSRMRALFPGAALYGYFPYAVVKLTIRRGVGALSPTFVVHERKC